MSLCSRCFLATAFLFSVSLLFVQSGQAEEKSTEPSEKALMKVASISFVPGKWEKAANADRIEKEVRAAAKDGAELVITPEGILEGYVVNEVIHAKDPETKQELTKRFQELAEPMNGTYIKRFLKLADELNIYLILGFLEAEKDKTYNTAALFSPEGTVIGKYRKTHFHQGYDVNPPGYTAGNEYPVFEVKQQNTGKPIRVGMMICFDRQLPEPARQLSINGAELIVCPSYGSWGEWNTRLMQVRAYENQSYVVFSHPKQSLMIGRGGDIMNEGLENSFTMMEIDLMRLAKDRQSVRMRRPDTYQTIVKPEK